MCIQIEMPDEVFADFVQAFRDFEQLRMQHHFRILATGGDLSIEEIERAFKSVTPPFQFSDIHREEP